MQTWLAWARGPVFWFAIGFMVLGMARHVIFTWWEVCRTYRRAGDKSIPCAQVVKATWQWLFPVRKLRDRTSYGVTTILFHVSIIVAPIFLGGHIVLIQRGTGMAWPALPNLAVDFLTVVAVLTAIALIVQRALRPDSRAVSRFGDYAIPGAIALPFASGFLVMHPALDPFPFDVTLLVHIMSADLVLVLIPITKISHCFLTPASQIVSEMAWHWPPDAGNKVAQTLGKENEPV